MKVAVTGASGFIGSAVCRLLQSNGAEVEKWSRQERLGYRQVSLSDPGSVARALATTRPTHLVHCGGTIPSKAPQAGLETYIESDVLPTIRLAAAAREADVLKLIVIGSASEYGLASAPQGPESAEQPNQPYGLQKLMTTRAVLALTSPDFEVVVLRPFTVYGPRQSKGMLIPDAIHAIDDGRELAVGDPRRVRDWIHVDDVARSVVAAAQGELSGMALPIGRGVGISVGDVLGTLSRISGAELRWRSDKGVRETDVHTLVADSGATETSLGWRAEIDIEAGLRQTLIT